MRRAYGLVCLVVVGLVVSACGGSGGGPKGEAPDSRTSVHGKGPYAVGTDIEPGVWVAIDNGTVCGGYEATKRTFDINDDSPGNGRADGFSVAVGSKQRIVLCGGRFFSTIGCSTWTLEDASPRTPDPATTAGGCTILVGGDDLVRTTLAYGHRPASERRELARRGDRLQQHLYAVVVVRNTKLGNAAGQLVDYLDDPDGYNVGAGTISKVTRAVDHIRQVCGTS